MNAQEITRLLAGNKVPVFLSAMAGITDPQCSLKVARAGHVAGVSIGGYDIDAVTHKASLEISKRRKEFTTRPERLFESLKTGLLAILSYNSCIINLRAVNGDYLPDFCEKVKELSLDSRWPPVIELNVHCTQPEMLEIGAGLELARKRKKIARLIKMVKNSGLLTSMKYKVAYSPETAFDSESFVDFLAFLKDHGLDILHLDSFQKGKNGNYALPITVASENVRGLMIIGNNSIFNALDGLNMLAAGAHAFSIARGYLKDELIFQRIHGNYLHLQQTQDDG